MRLTKTAIDHIKPPARGQVFFRDESLMGFALRVTPSGAKSFIVETRINGRMRRERDGAEMGGCRLGGPHAAGARYQKS
jgi:hypothetical protein